MNVRVFLGVATLVAWSACQCGGTDNGDPCATIHCGPGLVCNPTDGRCVLDQGSGGGGSATGGGTATGGGSATGGGTASGGGTGGGQGTCTPACGVDAPVCNAATNSCVVCTPTAGCSGATPVCDTQAAGGLGRCVTCTATDGCAAPTPKCDPTAAGGLGACFGCLSYLDCTTFGTTCDLNTHTCVPDDGGVGGGTGGGTGTVTFDDGGMTAHCMPFDAGTRSCTTECDKGFICESGVCVLRGSTGPVQVTLRFNQPEDLDLHVVEPLTDGGACDIYYGAPNHPPDGGYLPFPCGSLPHCGPNQVCLNNACVSLPVSSCGAQGWLDLDSNPACQIDNVDTENVIYDPHAVPTPGTYKVRVDYYQDCNSSSAPVPYEVEVRANGTTRWYCGTFAHGTSDSGNAGSGRDIASFIIQ